MALKHIKGLDTLRFVAAFWVVLSHVGKLPYEIFSHSNVLGKTLNGIYHNSVNGLAAVIIFFIISGFCIHYPYQMGKSLPLGSYLIRRSFRICIPLLAI